MEVKKPVMIGSIKLLSCTWMSVSERLVICAMKIRIANETARKIKMLGIEGYIGIVRNVVRIDANQITVAPCSLGKTFTH
jgi:hypothetical protein